MSAAPAPCYDPNKKAMVYALSITVVAGLLLLALIGGAAVLARRAAGAAAEGRAPFGRWRWYPSPLALLLLIPLAGLLLWRFFPALLFLPFILPFFWRGRRTRRPPFFIWNARRRWPSEGERDNGRDGTEDQ